MDPQLPVRIIATGPMLPQLRADLAAAFDTVFLPRADAALVTPDLAETVRGVAVMGPCDARFIAALPGLGIISSFGVGYDAVDVAQALRSNVVVTHTPGVLDEEVADTTIGLLLNTLRELSRAEAFLRAGRWAAGERYPLTRATLAGRRVGIFGLGRIGNAIARRLEPFGVSIAYHNRNAVPDVAWTWHPNLLDLAAAVDTLICVAPGGPSTRHAIGADVLAALGPEGVLVNVGRGSCVDEQALAAALRDGTIMAAGLDVFEDEPHVPAELLALPNVCLLPHVGSASLPTRNAMGGLVLDNLRDWFAHGRARTPVPECRNLRRPE